MKAHVKLSLPATRVCGNRVLGRAASALLVGLSGLGVLADTVRVTSWNVQSAATGPPLQQVLANLRSLNPDVILLQGVRDWQECGKLAEALRPERYNVLVCTSFRDPQGSVRTNGQVAVLAKGKGYFTWTEPWHGSNAGGGLAVAALQTRGQRLGFVCAKIVDAVEAADAARQLRDQIDSISRWEVNRVQTFVVGLSSERTGEAEQSALKQLVGTLQEAGYVDTLEALGADERATVSQKAGQPGRTCDFVLAQSAVFPSPLRPRTAVMGRYPVTCDLELDPALAAAAWTARAQELQVRATALRQADWPGVGAHSKSLAPGQPGADNPPAWWWAVGGGMTTALLFLLWYISRTARRVPQSDPRLLVDHVPLELARAASYTVTVSAPSGTGVDAPEGTEGSRVPLVETVELPRVQAPAGSWEERARKAEQRAERAEALAKQRLAGRLSRWLRKKFVRKLVTDRTALLEAQQSAALKAVRVEERLGRIELQIRQQTENYERRIEELSLELLAAREENREHIRSRIAQVKLEMESVRARMREQARGKSDSSLPA
ncbi:MAG TPA: hypothetical protein VJA21_09730 [Verrucomicrobiae bacterium]